MRADGRALRRASLAGARPMHGEGAWAAPLQAVKGLCTIARERRQSAACPLCAIATMRIRIRIRITFIAITIISDGRARPLVRHNKHIIIIVIIIVMITITIPMIDTKRRQSAAYPLCAARSCRSRKVLRAARHRAACIVSRKLSRAAWYSCGMLSCIA